MAYEILEKNKHKQFEDFNKASLKGHFCQSEIWGGVKIEWVREVVVVRDNSGAIIGGLALLVRKIPMTGVSMLYAPRGPVCDTEDEGVIAELLKGARAVAKKHNGYTIKLDPDVKSDNSRFIEIMKKNGFNLAAEGKNFEGIQPRYVFRLDVDGKTEEELMANFHDKWRYNIRLATRKGVEIKIAPREELKPFYDIMVETGMRDNFVTRPLSYFERMYDCMGEHLRLYMAYHEGEPIAGTLAVQYGDKVWYLYGASSNKKRNLMPNYLLQWEMIRWSVETNCKTYDFRGVSGDISEDNPLYGLYRFKKGFGGDFTEFCGEFESVISPSKAKLVEVMRHAYNRFITIRYRLKNRGAK